MSIDIHITAATPQEAREAMRGLLGMDRETAAPEPAAEPSSKAPRGKKADKPAVEPSAEGNDAAGAAPTTGSDVGASQPATAQSEPPSREEIAKKAVLYGQPGKGGPAALKELLTQHGAPNAKWNEVPDENLPALNAQLDELLAA